VLLVAGSEGNTATTRRIDYKVVSNSSEATEAFKQSFRRHAAGVAVITSLAPDGSPVGFTATSLASLSAVPPLATFNMSQAASAWGAMTVGNRVAIHTLGPKGQLLASRMAADHDLRFVGDHWTRGLHGVPLLVGATSWMIGTIVEILRVHGAAMVVVEVESGGLGEDDDALIYHERQYMKPVPHSEN
jgi:flavin reductase (DIM6/NTAB) family NADH-FMN oxidoreductase RutF